VGASPEVSDAGRVNFGLTAAKADHRKVLYAVTRADTSLLGPARGDESERPGTQFFKPLRHDRSVSDTIKAQIDLERHPSKTPGNQQMLVSDVIIAWNADTAAQRLDKHVSEATAGYNRFHLIG
jgi:hypothetical protein